MKLVITTALLFSAIAFSLAAPANVQSCDPHRLDRDKDGIACESR